MPVQLTILALPVVGGKFLPKFQFVEMEGPSVTFIPYAFGLESICETREKALALAKTQGAQEALERYGRDVKVILKEE